ncbi:HPr family phosphocarrier protein [Ancylobacter lacus]|uniref:HPr family phosphocarrier protein n=1 Tax=Ancylobacter lacus TaxID=2579970 RepID=UPI001BCC298F|nr:HPr family phosphocarrier protein [Ancylobacter lacus]MBS7537814.1 HPr family phosphocarrier protein [Ancylobacter lacus]
MNATSHPTGGSAAGPSGADAGEAGARGSALLTNAVGLHARPSVKLTQLAKSFAAAIEVGLGAEGPWVDAKSPVKIMRVKAGKGTVLHFRAEGPDAAAAVAALVALVERRFDEEESGHGDAP